jgi:hypothetical protein
MEQEMRKTRVLFFMALVLNACATPAPPPGSELGSESIPPPEAEPVEAADTPPAPPSSVSKKIPFAVSTRRMLQENQLPEIQYYLSTNLTLTRSQDKFTVVVNDKGELIQTSGREILEIHIHKETPGEMLATGFLTINGADIEYFGICFDDNISNILYFVPQEERNHYELLFYSYSEVKTVIYNDAEYEVSYDGDLPILLIVNESLSNDTIDRKNLTGRLLY